MPLDLNPSENRSSTERALKIAKSLFEPVKNAPTELRVKYPNVLQGDNFVPVCLVTKTHVFLEVVPKSQAKKPEKRKNVYRHIFCATDDDSKALYSIQERSIGLYSLNFGASPAIAIGSDTSASFADLKVSEDSRYITNPKTESISVLYVIGFGNMLYGETVWRELDYIIRQSLFNWSRR